MEGPPDSATERLAAGEALKDRVVEHLRRHGHDSISGIARALSAGRDAPVHRLTVAGYLQALADLGVLREMDRPPSKEYQLASPEAHWSLHQRLWRLLQDQDRGEEEKVRLLVAALQAALGRPVFQAELLHAGLPRIPPALEKVVVGDEARRLHRRLFERRSVPRIDVPSRDPMYALAAGDPLLGSPPVQDLLRRALVKSTGSEHLMAERQGGPAQVSLDQLGGGA